MSLGRESVMQDFKRLIAWQKAHALTLSVYRMAECLPRGKVVGLRSQVLRAVSSISANLAEGCGKQSDAEFARFVEIALSSALEVENHLILARYLALMTTEDFDGLERQVSEVRRILIALSRGIRERVKRRRRET